MASQSSAAQSRAGEDKTRQRDVLPKHDLVVPCSRGSRYASRCSSVPKRPMISMLPVSGAELLMASAQNRHLQGRKGGRAKERGQRIEDGGGSRIETQCQM